jgi:hypothetical protein
MRALLKNTSTNKTKEVKNLGWLLRNYSKVLCLEVLTDSNSAGDDNYGGCMLRALGNNFIYSCHFNSKKICIDWIKSHKRIFADLRLSVDNDLFIINQNGLSELK